MDDVLTGVKRLFWNPDELRLRALFRVPAVAGLLLLYVTLIVPAVGVVNDFVGLPDIFPQTVAIVLITIGLAAIAWFVDRRRLHDMGLGLDRKWGLDLLAGLVVGLVMAGVVVAVLVATGLATVSTTYAVEDPNFTFAAGSTPTALVYGFLFFATFATLEEILLRGYLLVNVAEGIRGISSTDRRAVLAAVGLTAALFGVLHAANPGGTALSLLNITAAGVFFGLAYAVTERLAFPIGVHVTWNFALGSLFGLPVSGLRTDSALLAVEPDGPTLVTGGSFGPEGGAVMLVALAVGVGAFVWWGRRQYGDLAVDERIAVPDLWVTDDPDS